MDMHKSVSWVVYQVPIRHKPGVLNAVCDWGEWGEMEASRPGYYTLIHSGISSEGEAERLARCKPSGDAAS